MPGKLNKALRRQQRSDIDIAVNVVGPTVKKNNWTTIGWTSFSISNIQDAGIDLFIGPNEVFVPDLIVAKCVLAHL